MAAISAAILTFVKTGDHVVAPRSMYSTTTNLLAYLAGNFGIETTFVDATDADAYRAAVRPNTKIFWIETPSNPSVQITDIRAVVEAARQCGAATTRRQHVRDPFNQQPSPWESTYRSTARPKYLGGHSDLQPAS
jgi:O-succinylhomoserine sulfhydrylase